MRECNHPTRGGRRKVKGPPAHLPHLPLTALRRLDASSEEPGDERVPKRLRSTSSTPRSTTPVSDSGRARAPFQLDRLMRIGSVGSPSGVSI